MFGPVWYPMVMVRTYGAGEPSAVDEARTIDVRPRRAGTVGRNSEIALRRARRGGSGCWIDIGFLERGEGTADPFGSDVNASYAGGGGARLRNKRHRSRSDNGKRHAGQHRGGQEVSRISLIFVPPEPRAPPTAP